MRFDGRDAAALGATQVLTPSSTIVQVSIEGMISGTAPTGPVRALAHVDGDQYAILRGDGSVALWRRGDNSVEDRTLTAVRLAGFSPLTVAAARVDTGLQIHRFGERIEPFGPVFAHEVELAVAPQAGRIAVGVTEQALDLPVEELPEAPPAPRTVLVLDPAGKTVGSFRAKSPITGVEISADGRFVLVAHEGGVVGAEVD
jgi:hypothetical protein